MRGRQLLLALTMWFAPRRVGWPFEVKVGGRFGTWQNYAAAWFAVALLAQSSHLDDDVSQIFGTTARNRG